MASILTPPSQYSWPVIFFLYFLGIALGAVVLGPSILPRTWSVPRENSLLTAHGKFLTSKEGTKSPYQFVTDSGEKIDLGCLPQAGWALCLNTSDLRYLASRTTKIGYFRVYNWNLPKLSNVLVTITKDNGWRLMPYDVSYRRLMAWSAAQQRVNHSFLDNAELAVFPLGFLMLAIWLSIKKRQGSF